MAKIILDKIRMTPTEIIPLSVDFKADIPTTDTIDTGSCDVTAVDSAGNDATGDIITLISASGTSVRCVISDVVDEEEYDVTFVCVTTAGYRFEGIVQILARI